MNFEKMKSIPRAVQRTIQFNKFNPKNSSKSYLEYIKKAENINEDITQIDVKNYFSFLNQTLTQPTKIPLKTSFIWATHLFHPKLYSKHPKTNTMNWFDSLNSKDSQEISFNVRDEKKFLKPSKKIMEMQEDIKRQIRFNKRVLAEKIDEDYLENAIERNKRFLLIKVENPGLIIVPTLDIDIIWHSHMLNHKEYICFQKRNFFISILFIVWIW
jgi:hypothetical protein